MGEHMTEADVREMLIDQAPSEALRNIEFVMRNLAHFLETASADMCVPAVPHGRHTEKTLGYSLDTAIENIEPDWRESEIESFLVALEPITEHLRMRLREYEEQAARKASRLGYHSIPAAIRQARAEASMKADADAHLADLGGFERDGGTLTNTSTKTNEQVKARKLLETFNSLTFADLVELLVVKTSALPVGGENVTLNTAYLATQYPLQQILTRLYTLTT